MNKETFCFIAVASLKLTPVSYCKNDKRGVEEESGQQSDIPTLMNGGGHIQRPSDFSFLSISSTKILHAI